MALTGQQQGRAPWSAQGRLSRACPAWGLVHHAGEETAKETGFRGNQPCPHLACQAPGYKAVLVCGVVMQPGRLIRASRVMGQGAHLASQAGPELEEGQSQGSWGH